MELKITKSTELKEKPDQSALGFGNFFTDHMFLMQYDTENGWHDARIEPYGPFSLSPATMMLHYGQGVFEGMKAYVTSKGEIQLFRPRENFKRMNRSNKMVCIPEFDMEFVLNALKQLLVLEKDWIPKAPGTSLYIRPTIIATDAFLGVRASNTYQFFIILSPVGAYYAAGFNPVKIWVTKDHVRAVRGGIGEAKTAGNYAASLFAGENATKNGYAQVLWMDGVEQKYIEEVGSMNIFFVIDNEIITPELNGSILPGVTRNSVIELARHWGMKVSERKISMEDVVTAYDSGKLTEIFGSGTAAVISPVGELKYEDRSLIINDGKVGEVSQKLFDSIQNIQCGAAEDPLSWVEHVE